MAHVSTLRRAAASVARSPHTAVAHAESARSEARLLTLPTRRFASGKPSSGASNSANGAAGQPAQKVTRAMIVHEGREILKLLVGGLVIGSALVASSGFVIETMKQINPKPAPGRFVQIKDDDGNAVQVHLQRLGSGDVTVIFDGGVGETSFDWDKVAQEVAKFASVLSIDRPGLGFSTKGKSPRTAERIAKEYTQVLDALKIRGKVVLVAHGAGGYNMRQLAENLQEDSTSPINCQGLVLVDALQENLRAELESVSEPVQKALQAMDKNGDTVLMLSRIGVIRLITSIQQKKNATKYSPEALPYIEFFTPTPAHRAAANEENLGLPLTEQRFRDAASSRGFEFPCVVLSHGRADLFDSMKIQAGVDMAAIAALEQKWQHAQRTLAKTVGVTSSTQIVVTDAGHNIHHEKPEEIAKIVRALVDEAREKGSATGLASIQAGTCPV